MSQSFTGASSLAASALTGTVLASNVVTSSLTTIGTLVAGAVPASLVTAGTFGAGNYGFPGNLIFTDNSRIGPDTADASDNESFFITGGGGTADTRGAWIELRGNEDGGTGELGLHAGDVAGGILTLYTGGGVSVTIDESQDMTLAGGLTASGLVLTPATAAGGAGLRLPHGTAPTSPVDGDKWTTTTASFERINGVTKQVAYV